MWYNGHKKITQHWLLVSHDEHWCPGWKFCFCLTHTPPWPPTLWEMSCSLLFILQYVTWLLNLLPGLKWGLIQPDWLFDEKKVLIVCSSIEVLILYVMPLLIPVTNYGLADTKCRHTGIQAVSGYLFSPIIKTGKAKLRRRNRIDRQKLSNQEAKQDQTRGDKNR